MGAISLILAKAADPDWMGASAEMNTQVQEINTFAGTMGGMGWTLPVGVLALVFLKMAPSIGAMIQAEHELSIERRRRLDALAEKQAQSGGHNGASPDKGA